MVPCRYVSQEEIDAEVKKVVGNLGPEVRRVRYTVGEDTSGEPGIFFRIVLADNAVWPWEILSRTTRNIRSIIRDQLQPLPTWGLFPYFNFRSESEQAGSTEPEWT
jgi:hypothetical protein